MSSLPQAELKRFQTALAEAADSAARRQADFDNYRKRIEEIRWIRTIELSRT